MLKKIIPIFLLLSLHGPSFAEGCNFEDFFKQEYGEISSCIPCDNQKEVLGIIYNAYSIKLQGLQTQYNLEKEKYDSLLSNNEAGKEEIDFEKRKLNDISDQAMEEYSAFIEDVNFEMSDCDKCIKKQLDKSAKSSIKGFKKMVKANCKNRRKG